MGGGESAETRSNWTGMLPHPSTEALGYHSEHPFPSPQALLSNGEGYGQFLPQQVQSSRRGQGGGSQRNMDFSGQHLPKAKFLIT